MSLLEEALMVIQCLIAMLTSALISWGVGYYSSQWPEKIRGSVIGIVVLSVLMFFSSIPVYSNQLAAEIADNKPVRTTFLQVYP